jgi:hypothetical protein
MSLSLAELAADEALKELAQLGSTAAGLTYAAYKGTSRYMSKRTRQPFYSGSTRPPKMLRGTYVPSYQSAATSAPSRQTRTRRTRFRHNLGVRPGSFASKKVLRASTKKIGDAEKTLHVYEMVRIPFSDDDDSLNTRNAKLVNVRGVKWRHWFQFKPDNTSTRITRPVSIRWAVINPKDNTGQGSVDVDGSDFFISHSPDDDFTQDFPATGTTFRYMNKQINRKKYGVLKEGSFVLSPDVTSGNITTNAVKDSSFAKLIHFYVPIKRQMKWGDNITELPVANIYFVWWYCKLADLDTAATYVDVNTTPIQHMYEHQTYFRTAKPFF